MVDSKITALNDISNVLFDLDGTLVDSRGTIAASLAHALEQVGVNRPDNFSVETLIGRPLLDIFEGDFLLDREQALVAIEIYRDYYDRLEHAGTRVYEEVVDLLQALQAAGYKLYVATVKPTGIAEDVLSGMQLRPYFTGVAGASRGPERRDKSRIIAHAIHKFELDPARSVMIGDRRQDIDGARENGLAALAVSYGFGSRQELVSARPLVIVDRPTEITGLLR